MDKTSKKILGAFTINYLLEKSRVSVFVEGERNYHIFYHLMKSGDMPLLDRLKLTVGGKISIKDYYFMN